MTADHQSTAAIETPRGDLVRWAQNTWRVELSDETLLFTDLAAALERLGAEFADESSRDTTITFHLPVPELLDVVSAAGGDELFAWCSNGWARLHGTWIPTKGLPDFGGDFEELDEVDDSFGEFGVWGTLYRHESCYFFTWHAADGAETGDDCFGVCTVESAAAQANALIDNVMSKWGVKFSKYIGLDNLAPADRFELPASAVEIGQRRTTTNWEGETVAEVSIHEFVNETGATQWLVSTDEVVGVYDSPEALETQQTVDPGLDIEIFGINSGHAGDEQE